jgi:diguanylate cyclase (GGDEF)-like protein
MTNQAQEYRRLLLEQAHKDCLTGFYERGALFPYLESLIEEADRSGKPFALCLMDLEKFKKFNDKFGHIFGDDILRYVASTLQLTFYEGERFFFRYGGDEFIGIFPYRGPKDVLALVRRCHRNLMRRPFLFKNTFYRITVSSGIACFPEDAKSVQGLIKKADEAMYYSKRHGRNQVTVASQINFLQVRNIVMLLSLCFFVVIVFLLGYRLTYRKYIQPTIDQIKYMKFITKPDRMDKIILKTGSVVEGTVLSDAGGIVMVDLHFDKGEGAVTFKKTEVAEIQYGRSNPSRSNP